ncbi:MAG: DUF2779 domain-containing protein [Balneolaceae bacterium]|nr:DUF2779 domain-containing protein [Balneolaceae bacterium]
MMPASNTSEGIINDHIFLETLRCPLKFKFLTSDEFPDSSRPVYRQRNKLNVRDAVATLFTNVRHTSNETAVALGETKSWLEEDEVAICGAVVKSGVYLTRIPILYKKGNKLTVIQIHGKLRKRTSAANIDRVGLNRTENSYLLKAAYRMGVLNRNFPESQFSAEFYFPRKDFRSGMDLLHRHNAFDETSQEREENFKNLFARVAAGLGADELAEELPSSLAHSLFAGKSIRSAMDEIEKFAETKSWPEVERSRECGYCAYRESEDFSKSCWQIHFSDEAIKNPENHTFELMGHGNTGLIEKNLWFSEEVKISDGFSSFDIMKSHGGPKITIQQRRNLQILKSKNEDVPFLWMKEGIHGMKNLNYPLHFMDFEASTYAIPMKRGDSPYNSVYFQFSAISLFEDGRYEVSEWLDTDPETADPHEIFVDELGKIPGIFDGTIIQYSPFEKQAINRLISDLQRNSMLHSDRIEKLMAIRSGSKRSDRFFDLSEWIRNYYYNGFLKNSLGLKQVLEGIMQLEKTIAICNEVSDPLATIFSKADELQAAFDDISYKSIQENGSGIEDGSAAMNAWISLKCGLLDTGEQVSVPSVLRKYCTLDAYAMVCIYIHILKLISKHEGEIIMYNEK